MSYFLGSTGGTQGCKLFLLVAFLLFNHYSFNDRTMKLYVQVVVIFLAGLLLSFASGGIVTPYRKRNADVEIIKDYGPVVTPIILTMEPRVRTYVVPPLPSNDIEEDEEDDED
ncbi:uncharacterized protein LOC120421048 [Culex pipiens pallens]|uniref:uncharacterized protein LOC120421048 n=1 Tax=Culex pipiens pallens TaxID=42434 RepID=UPI0022AAD948|nr:uncharacterized protein LOC120421048 [Culex pipiens pallens]